jgi:TolB-like protein
MLTVVGCFNKLERVKTDQEPYSKIIRTSYAATDVLADILKQRDFDSEGAVIAASLVNINNLSETCSLGRIVSEQMRGRLAQHGYRVVEMKLRQDSIFIKKNEGEFLLSRELQNIGEQHHASAVLVGTYAVSKYVVFISVRMIRTSDNTVIASYDYQLPLDFITKSLI